MSRTEVAVTVFQFTVMHPADMAVPDLASALVEADTGQAVGSERVISFRLVPEHRVPAMLRKLGSDGTFFDGEPE